MASDLKVTAYERRAMTLGYLEDPQAPEVTGAVAAPGRRSASMASP